MEVGRLGTRHDFYVVEHKNRGILGIFREKCVTLQPETDGADYIYGFPRRRGGSWLSSLSLSIEVQRCFDAHSFSPTHHSIFLKQFFKLYLFMSYNLLKGKRGIIFGALNDKSIAWKVAERAVEEGATITLSNAPVAVRLGDIEILGKKLNAELNGRGGGSPQMIQGTFYASREKISEVFGQIFSAPEKE